MAVGRVYRFDLGSCWRGHGWRSSRGHQQLSEVCIRQGATKYESLHYQMRAWDLADSLTGKFSVIVSYTDVVIVNRLTLLLRRPPMSWPSTVAPKDSRTLLRLWKYNKVINYRHLAQHAVTKYSLSFCSNPQNMQVSWRQNSLTFRHFACFQWIGTTMMHCTCRTAWGAATRLYQR